MPVFKCFWKIINQHKLGMFLYIGIFMAITLIYTTLGGDSETQATFNATSINLAIIDRDESTISEGLTGYLGDLHQLVDLDDNERSLQDALFFREVEYILIIPAGFGEDFQANKEGTTLENIKVPNSTSGMYVDSQIDNYLVTLQAYLHVGFDVDSAIESTVQDLDNQVTVEVNMAETEVSAASPYYFQYLPYIFTSITIVMLGPIFIAFNRGDIARRMECSSLTFKEKNLQIALGCVISSLAIWLVFMIVPFILYREEMNSSIGTLRIINSFAFLVVSVGIALLLGQVMKNNNVLSAASNVIGLGMSFLTGVFVPQEFLSSGVLAIARFLPAYWYVRSNDMLTTVSVVNDENMRLFFEGIGIQAAFAVILFIAVLVVSHRKKLKPAA